MDDTQEIIYMSLCNSYIYYNGLLENTQDMAESDITMLNYVALRTSQLIDEFHNKLSKEDSKTTPNIIQRPQW